MATILIDFPDGQAARIRDGLCGYGGYRDTLEDGSPNPITRGQFAKRTLAKLGIDAVRAYEKSTAIASAEATAAPDIT